MVTFNISARILLLPVLALIGIAHLDAATLRHHYPLDTNARDGMGVTNLTSVGDSVTFQASGGAAGGFLRLGGSDDYLLATTGSNLSVLGDYSSTFRPFSLSCWVRQTATQAASGTISVIGMTTESSVTSSATPNFNTGFELATRESSAGLGVRVRARAGGTGDGAGFIATGLNVANGSWHHLVVNFEAGGRSVYVDGVLAGSSTTAVAFPSGQPITRFAVGAFLRATQIVDDLNGDVDDLQIYDGALTATEALQLFQSPGLTLNNNLPPVNTTDILPAGTPLADVVDTMIGVAGGTGTGSTVPGACLPQSSVYPSPDTVAAAAGGYQAGSDTVGFSQLHATGSGSSTMSFGNFLVSPRIGANSSTNEDDHGSPITNVNARPYSYRGRLVTPGIDCTVVPTANCAIYQFDFPASSDARIYFDVARKLNLANALTNGSVTVDLANGTISGGGTFDGNWNPAAYNVYFYAKLDTTPTSGGTWLNSTPTDGTLSVTTTTRQRIGSWVRFNTNTNRTVRMKIGVSFQSAAKARQYVESEIPAWDLLGLEATAKAKWNELLSVVQTPGITTAEARKLYTALFHSLIQPRNRTGDPTGWPADAPFWDDQYTPWDTWQTLYPLLGIVSPSSMASIVNSFGERYARNGKAETAFIQGKDFQVGQGGDEVDRIIADAYVKGIPGIDWAKIWPLMQFHASRRTDDYRALGFVSMDGGRGGYDSRMEAASSTIAFAHGDWCAAQIGASLGYSSEAQTLLTRSENWRNVWDATLTSDGFSGFVRGKYRNGSFSTTAATAGSGTDFYQGTCWNYSFNIHDRNAMMDLMGGRASFIQRLEFAFGKNSTSYLDFSNEVNLQAVPLLSRAQRPALSAYWADNVRNRFGIYNCPGDEDSGAMSSLYFFLTAGFVPSATEDTYYLHGPRIPRQEYSMGGGRTFTVTAANAGGANIYVQSATLDGQPLHTPVIHHSDITSGSTLAFVMGPNPTTWGTGADFSGTERSGLKTPVNAGWTAALGSPQITGSTSDSPVWGSGANGADNSAIHSTFPEVTLSQPGASITLAATVTLNGMAATQATPNARFAWGLFNSTGQNGVTGWTGYLAANDTLDAAGRQSIWRKNSGNTTAYHSSSSATTLTSYSLPTQAFADGTYRLVMTLERSTSGALDYHAALVRSSDGVLFAAFTGSDSTPPNYTFNRVGLRVGDVLDVDSVQVSQATVITHGIPAPPSVSISNPTEGTSFPWPNGILIAADATAASGKTISKVTLFANGIPIGEATSAPYTFSWYAEYSGTYTLTATAIDNEGETATSSPVNIILSRANNTAPSVVITSPTAGAVRAGNINLSAQATDPDGFVSKVEFFNGNTKLGEATTAPFAIAWPNVPVGTYMLSAKATDNDGAVTTSTNVAFQVLPAPLTFAETFDSLGASGTAPPVGWSVLNGNTGSTNTTWTDLVPIFGSGANSVATMVPASGALTVNNAPTVTNNNGYNSQGTSTTDRMLVTSPTSVSGVALQWQVTNSSTSTVTGLRIGYDIRRYTAAAAANELPGYWLFYSLDNGASWVNVAALNPTLGGSGVQVPNTVGVTTVPPTTFALNSAWAPGTALMLRWVDDNAEATSPDQIIGLDNVTLTSTAPIISLTAPIAGETFTAPAAITLTTDANDGDGTITNVEFFNGATLLGQTSSPPYSHVWTGVAAGTYNLTARATDNEGNVTVSNAVSVTVSAATGSGMLTRGPYLQKAAPTAMTIRWRSSQSIAGRVRFGTSLGNLTSSATESQATTEHEILLTDLSPATTYFYSIGSALDTLLGDATTTFTTPPATGTATPTRIWVLGNAGTGTNNQRAVRDAFYHWTGSHTPNLVLQLGGNAYSGGTDSDFQTALFEMYPTLLRRTPFWSCQGIQEANQTSPPPGAYPYFDIYSFPAAGECGGTPSGTESYYSWNHGNIHFISLDSLIADRTSTGPQATWLRNDLAATTAAWIICIMHHSPYTKGSQDSDSDAAATEMRQNILPILEEGGVDLVFSAHSNSYERSVLLDRHYGLSGTLAPNMKKNAGNGRVGTGNGGAYIKPLTGPRDHFGTVYCVTGSAGQTAGGKLNHPAHVVSLNELGSTVLDIDGNQLDLTFLRENGTIADTFTMIKQGAADSDGDGVPDAFEIAYSMNRFDPSDATTKDIHGMTAVTAYLFGIEPGSGSTYPWTVSSPDVATGTVTVTFPTLADRKYQVFWSTNLTTWNLASPEIIGDGTTHSWTDDSTTTSSQGDQRFYRVQIGNYP